MPKTFYTENDIKALAARGIQSLAINDDIVLTDLARQKARDLGIKLLRGSGATAAPPAQPARPSPPDPASADLLRRVRQAVTARLEHPVDPALLDAVIQQVLASMERK
ncbi:MAG: hypothetical protein JW892_10250 [Anaerolineae bacterium]|nr:hypothetical protein [Anaerolineae bacterium]